MSDAKKVLVNHPDGRICEVPVEVLDKYVLPPERVKELAREAGARAAAEQPAAEGGPHAEGAERSMVLPASGQSVVFNFYLGPQAKLALHATGPGAPARDGADVEGYHMDMDAMGSMTLHTDWRVGPYIDKSGRPGFGPHSHDPVAGNAQ
jgi:hypothetical protein